MGRIVAIETATVVWLRENGPMIPPLIRSIGRVCDEKGQKKGVYYEIDH